MDINGDEERDKEFKKEKAVMKTVNSLKISKKIGSQ